MNILSYIKSVLSGESGPKDNLEVRLEESSLRDASFVVSNEFVEVTYSMYKIMLNDGECRVVVTPLGLFDTSGKCIDPRPLYDLGDRAIEFTTGRDYGIDITSSRDEIFLNTGISLTAGEILLDPKEWIMLPDGTIHYRDLDDASVDCISFPFYLEGNGSHHHKWLAVKQINRIYDADNDLSELTDPESPLYIYPYPYVIDGGIVLNVYRVGPWSIVGCDLMFNGELIRRQSKNFSKSPARGLKQKSGHPPLNIKAGGVSPNSESWTINHKGEITVYSGSPLYDQLKEISLNFIRSIPND